MAATGAGASDGTETVTCPLCGRNCVAERGLRMHLMAAHSEDVRDRDHFLHLLGTSATVLAPTAGSEDAGDDTEGVRTPVSKRRQYPVVKIVAPCPLGAAPKASVLTPACRIASAGGSAALTGNAGDELPIGFAAARDGHLAAIQDLVEGTEAWKPHLAIDKHGSGVLTWAAGSGHLDVCRYLVSECGVDPARANPRRGRGHKRTALHWAARGGHRAVCHFLITGVAPSSPSQPRPGLESRSPALPGHCAGPAAGVGAETVTGTRVEAMWEAGPSTTVPKGSTGVQGGPTDQGFPRCWKASADPVAGDGTTPFHWAAWGGHLEVCRMLVAHGADPHRANGHGCTAVHWAALSGNVDLCRWLAAPVLNGTDSGLKWTEAGRQAQAGKIEGNVRGKGEAGPTEESEPGAQAGCAAPAVAGGVRAADEPESGNAGKITLSEGRVEMGRGLQGGSGLDWGKKNLQGHTACHKAALKGCREVLEWLLRESGVGREGWGRDQGGYSPPDVARLAGHLELADWLEGQLCGLWLEAGVDGM